MCFRSVCERTSWNFDTLIKFFFSLLYSSQQSLFRWFQNIRTKTISIASFCVAVVIIEGIFFFQTKDLLQCEQMVPVLLFLLCFIFITTNLRLAGGYHLPSAVDAVLGEKYQQEIWMEKKKVSNILLYILFSLGKKHMGTRNMKGWRIKNNETHPATKSTNSHEGWNLSQ